MSRPSGPSMSLPLRLHFLVFAPRSGSTLFAQTMSETCPGTMIVPEFRTAEYLLARSEHRVRGLSSRSLRRLFEADRQLLTNLGISRETATALAGTLAGAGTLEILAAIISTYAKDEPQSRDVVLKLGGGAEFLPRLQEVSPEGTVVHVYRDGRAAVNSLLRTPRAYFRNETMGRGDVAYCCGLWLRHQRTLRRGSAGSYRVISVRYETFVEAPHDVSRATAGAMRLDDAARSSVRSFNVSKAEAGLHPLVGSPAAVERRAAWRAEMPRQAQVFADWRLRGELTRLGYRERVIPSPGVLELSRCIASTYARHVTLLSSYTLARSVAYARRPGAVAEHVNARIARFLSRRRHAS